jgi:hypothetical protein
MGKLLIESMQLRLQIRRALGNPRRGLVSRAGRILRIPGTRRPAAGIRPSTRVSCPAGGAAILGRIESPGRTSKLKRKLKRRQRSLIEPLTRHEIISIDRQLLKREYPPIPGYRLADMTDHLLLR